jgi:hypothetical protein
VSARNHAGVEYAKLSETKEGDTLIADDTFPCLTAGPHVVRSSEDGPWVECNDGVHLLDGACGADGDYLIGFTRQDEAADDAETEITDSHLGERWA